MALELVPENGDAVTQERGGFEVELLCGIFHLLSELFDACGDVAELGGFVGALVFVGMLVGDVVLDILNVFDDRARRDAVFEVECFLDGAASSRLVDGFAEAVGECAGIEDDAPVGVSGGASDGLYEGAPGAQEALLVGVEDADELHFREVEAFAQEVDADEDVELSEAEVA